MPGPTSTVDPSLAERPKRTPDPALENVALIDLIDWFEDGPTVIVDRCAAHAARLCATPATGMSLIETADGDATLRIAAAHGPMQLLTGRRFPASEVPCGLALASGAPTLVPDVAARFPTIANGWPAIGEVLTVPLRARDGSWLGTIWAAGDGARRFDLEDARELAVLGGAAAAAIEIGRSRERQALLLREQRHRTVNDLQLVASLLSVQRARIADGDARAAIDDVIMRIRAIADLRDTVGTIETADVSLAEVLGHVHAALVALTDAQHVLVTLSLGDDLGNVSSDRAMAIGLAVNELATNAMKHAFGARDMGRIEISAVRPQHDVIEVRVCDDGAPYAPSGTGRAGIGLRLVKGLTAQMQGRLIEPAPGSKLFTMRLPG